MTSWEGVGQISCQFYWPCLPSPRGGVRPDAASFYFPSTGPGPWLALGRPAGTLHSLLGTLNVLLIQNYYLCVWHMHVFWYA